MSTWAKHDPSRQHSHFGPFAVDLGLQGRGIGTVLRSAYCRQVDDAGRLSYLKARLVVAAIEMAVARRGGDVVGCILHSDRGSQFRARKVHRELARYGMVGSMGQVGSAGDNATMESFFALLQKNVLERRHRWATRDDLRIEIATWIERTYHQRRRQAALGLTPIEYETIMTPQTATAA